MDPQEEASRSAAIAGSEALDIEFRASLNTHSPTFDVTDVPGGIPKQLSVLGGVIEAGLTGTAKLVWPGDCLDAILIWDSNLRPILNTVWPRFIAWLLADAQEGVIQLVGDDGPNPGRGNADVRSLINEVADLFRSVSVFVSFPPAWEQPLHAVDKVRAERSRGEQAALEAYEGNTGQPGAIMYASEQRELMQICDILEQAINSVQGDYGKVSEVIYLTAKLMKGVSFERFAEKLVELITQAWREP